jgi:hypothetical protein
MLGKIFLFLLVYLLIRMVIYYFRAKSVFKQMIQQAQQQQSKSIKKEGEVTVSFDANGKRKSSRDKGNYTDYEVIE